MVIMGQALLLAFLLGKAFDRLDHLDNEVAKIQFRGSDALQVDEEKLRALTARVTAIEGRK